MPHPSTPRGLTPAQRDVFATLLRLDQGEGVTRSIRALAAEAQLTEKQATQALNGLMNSNAITKTWDPDRYVWTYRIAGA